MPRRKEEPPVEVTLPITPMLDMSFQLLSFFILTFKPLPTEGQMSVALPRVDVTETPPVDVPPLPDDNKKDEYTIVLRASSGGDLADLSMRGPAGDFGVIQNVAGLQKRMEEISGKRENISITIEADNDLTYARLIDVMDLCRKAGYDTVNLTPTRKERS